MRYYIKLDSVQKPERKHTLSQMRDWAFRLSLTHKQTRTGRKSRKEALERVAKLNRAK